MTANSTPIFTLKPISTFASITGVDGSQDGTDADVKLIYTAQASDGGFIQRLIFQPISTSGSTTTSAAAGRVYINKGSTVGTASNNTLIREITLPATAVNVAGTTAAIGYDMVLNIQLAAGYKIYCGISAMAANTAWQVATVSGDYS